VCSDVYRELVKEKIPDEKLNLIDYEQKCMFVYFCMKKNWKKRINSDKATKVYSHTIDEIMMDKVLKQPFVADPQQSVLFEKIEKTLK
jgi:hypothetical protein